MRKLTSILLFAFLLLLSACEEYPVSSISLDRSQITMDAGEIYQLEVIIQPLSSAYAKPTTWKSSDEAVAVVNSSGVVTAVYTGTCIITASAGNHKAVCEVVVNKLEFGFEFKRAKALYYGDNYEVGTNSFSLRLLGDGVLIDEEGKLSGDGLFINIDLQLPLTDLAITSGTYNFSEIRQEYTFAPGEIYKEGLNTFAIGTYVGQRTANGLSVIFVKSGSFWISLKGNTYRLEGHLIGKDEEDIVVTFNGLIPVIDKTVSPPETIILEPFSVVKQALGDSYTTGLNVFRYTITCLDNKILQLEFYAPLSVTTQIPTGTYLFSGATTYSLVKGHSANSQNYGAWYTDTQGSKKVVGSQVVVTQSGEQQNFKCKLIDERGRIIDVNYTY